MVKVKEKDFIEMDYTGIIKDTNTIFDTTYEDVAKKQKFETKDLKPLILCVGKRDVVEGLDEALVGKEIGKEHEIELSPEKAFGMRDPKLLEVLNTNHLLKEKINPVPGLPIQYGNKMGIIRTVSGGRVTVDFNYPLAGKTLIYKFKINRIVTDDTEKAKAFVSMHLKTDKVEVKDGKMIIDAQLPEEIIKLLEPEVKERIPTIQHIILKTTNKE